MYTVSIGKSGTVFKMHSSYTPSFDTTEIEELLQLSDGIYDELASPSTRAFKPYFVKIAQGYQIGLSLLKSLPATYQDTRRRYRISVSDFLKQFDDSEDIYRDSVESVKIALGCVLLHKQKHESNSIVNMWTVEDLPADSCKRAKTYIQMYLAHEAKYA